MALALVGVRSVIEQHALRRSPPEATQNGALEKKWSHDAELPRETSAAEGADEAMGQESPAVGVVAPIPPPPEPQPSDDDVDVASAVGHLRAGRYAEARAAYAALAARNPEVPAYAALERILALHLDVKCTGYVPFPHCPQVNP